MIDQLKLAFTSPIYNRVLHLPSWAMVMEQQMCNLNFTYKFLLLIITIQFWIILNSPTPFYSL